MVGIYNIPAGYPFLESLAKQILKEHGSDPFQFSKIEIFLPTRRACGQLQQAFLKANKNKSLLLPQISPLGDIEENDFTPTVSPLKRLGLLTNLIENFAEKTHLSLSPLLSLKLAKSLLRLMDQATIENVSWEGLTHLVPSEFAEHWQLTLDFLDIISSHWPKILLEKGLVEPYQHHKERIDNLLHKWETNPPLHPVIAAGSTGTMPATTKLLEAITQLPKGKVILPGLDRTLNEKECHDCSPCHPQFALITLLEKLQLSPSQIPLWDESHEEMPRAFLFSKAMKPSLYQKINDDKSILTKALENLYYIPCDTPQEEALVIAMLLRQQLETPELHAALVTSDLKLVERVRHELKRWNIEIDSSAGETMEMTREGIFLSLCATFISDPSQQIPLLSLIKHPLFHLKRPSKSLCLEIYEFEKNILRGNGSKSPTWLKELFSHLPNPKDQSFQSVIKCHAEFAEMISTDDQGTCHLWKDTKSEPIKNFFDSLIEVSHTFPAIALENYPQFLKELFQGHVVRNASQKHPRLSILGPLEARLFSTDVVILAGLNEGTWPPTVRMEPWLNRSMSKELGFPSPERRIGQSGHDFGQAFAKQKVYMTRSIKVDGTPTLACRWLERLEFFLKPLNLTLPSDEKLCEWAKQLDSPSQTRTSSRPEPRPPLSSRPRKLSVTQIETWIRDPYAFYAKHILSLNPLNPLEIRVQASDRGTLAHQILDKFFKLCKDPFQKDALDTLIFIGTTLFEPYLHEESVRLYWWPRFKRIAEWFIAHERANRLPGTQTHTEVKGKMNIHTPQGIFTCSAKADRIDILPNGQLRILDYKTGMPPSDQDVNLGFSPQLPLEGAIALENGFQEIHSNSLDSLQFWWLKGDAQGGVVKTISGNPTEISQKAKEGLKNLILMYDNVHTSYPALPNPNKELKYNDYAHLARLEEWGKC